MSPRAATTAVFFANGAMIGTWVAHIPSVQDRLDVSKSTIGIALLCMAAGALIAMPLTGQVLHHRSSASVTRAAALTFCLLLPLPLLMPTPVALAASLVLFGAANGAMDVAMNAHGVAVERERGRPIMSSLHAGWSFGGLAGAAGVALGAALGLDIRVQGAIATAFAWLIALAATRHLGTASSHSDEPAGRLTWPSRAVLPLGVLCFLVAVTEGAMGDWSGIYLKRDLGADASTAATGFAAFSLGMALGRLVGDDLNRRLGAGRLLRSGMALVAVALAAFLAIGEPVPTVVGLAILGLGISNSIPLLFSAAGRVPPAGPSMSAVFTIGYLGFLVGPPLIGFLADAIGLPSALALLVLFAGAVAVAGGRAAGVEAAGRDPVGAAHPA
jgi:predicted MFS family arabinose efflux permease